MSSFSPLSPFSSYFLKLTRALYIDQPLEFSLVRTFETSSLTFIILLQYISLSLLRTTILFIDLSNCKFLFFIISLSSCLLKLTYRVDSGKLKISGILLKRQKLIRKNSTNKKRKRAYKPLHTRLYNELEWSPRGLKRKRYINTSSPKRINSNDPIAIYCSNKYFTH